MLNYRGEQVLARFPGPVTIRPELTVSVGLFMAVSMLFAIACLWGAWHGWHVQDYGSSTWGLSFMAALFALFAVGSAVMLRTNSMTLDSEGFKVVIGLRRKHFLWRDVSTFKKQSFGSRNYGIAFDVVGIREGTLSALNRKLGFHNSALFEDFGWGEEQLAELLNHWHDRALAEGSSGHD